MLTITLLVQKLMISKVQSTVAPLSLKMFSYTHICCSQKEGNHVQNCKMPKANGEALLFNGFLCYLTCSIRYSLEIFPFNTLHTTLFVAKTPTHYCNLVLPLSIIEK